MSVADELRGIDWPIKAQRLARKGADEIERLQATLKKYGRHNLDGPSCAVYAGRNLTCDCGWGDILKTLQE